MNQMREFEHNRALMEAHRNTAVDEYFKARPQLMRTRHEECLVEAGFTKAWDLLQAAQPAAVPVVGDADRDIAVMRASITAYKEGKNGIERHPGNTAHENAAWEWGQKDGGWS